MTNMSHLEFEAMRELYQLVVGGGTLAALSPHEFLAERAAAYSGGYSVRTQEAMRATFPATAAVLDELWTVYGLDYVRKRAWRYTNLNDIGEGFPAFLIQEGAPAALSELAQFEWLQAQIRRRPRLAPPDAATMSGWDESTRVCLQPHASVLRVRFAVEETAVVGQLPRAAPGTILLNRKGGDVVVERLAEARAAFVEGLIAGASLGDLVENGLGEQLAEAMCWAVEKEILVADSNSFAFSSQGIAMEDHGDPICLDQ